MSGPWKCSLCGAVRDDPAADRPGVVGRNHPATAKAAAQRITPRTGTQRARVLEAIAAAYPEGLTDDEIIHRLGMLHQTVGPRRGELRRDGWIEDSGERRTTRAGNPAIVWRYIP